MNHYVQLTQEQRYQIYVMPRAGMTQSDAAIEIGADKYTIIRE